MIKEGYTKEYRERAKEEYDRRLREKRKNYMHPTVTKKIEKLMRRKL